MPLNQLPPISLIDAATFEVTNPGPCLNVGEEFVGVATTAKVIETGVEVEEVFAAAASVELIETGEEVEEVFAAAPVELIQTGHGVEEICATAPVELIQTGDEVEEVFAAAPVELIETGDEVEVVVVTAAKVQSTLMELSREASEPRESLKQAMSSTVIGTAKLFDTVEATKLSICQAFVSNTALQTQKQSVPTGSQLDYFIQMAKENPSPFSSGAYGIEYGIEFRYGSSIKKTVYNASVTMGQLCYAICKYLSKVELMEITIGVVEFKRSTIVQFRQHLNTEAFIYQSLENFRLSEFWNPQLESMKLDNMTLHVISNFKNENDSGLTSAFQRVCRTPSKRIAIDSDEESASKKSAQPQTPRKKKPFFGIAESKNRKVPVSPTKRY